MKRIKYFVATLVLTFIVAMTPCVDAANFYWKSTFSDLNAISGKADGDRGIVIDSAGLMTSYYHTGGGWVVASVLGGIQIMTDVTGPTAAQMYGGLNLITTGTPTVLLPTAVAGMNGCVMDTGAAHDIIVDVQAGDDIALVGVEQANGVGVTNASGSSTGDFICVVAGSAGHWFVMGKQGTWASQ